MLDVVVGIVATWVEPLQPKSEGLFMQYSEAILEEADG